MIANVFGFVILLILSLGVAFSLQLLLTKSLRALLDEAVQLPPCTTFYTRLLAIGLFLIALSSSLDVKFYLKDDAAFMEYVWEIASGLSSVFGMTSLFLTGFLLMITILLAVLGRRRE
jgi:hypothetical protein